MKVQSVMLQVAIEGLYKKHRFSFTGRNLFLIARIDQREAYGVQGRMRIVAQKLVDRSQFTDLRRTPNDVIFKTDYNAVDSFS
jgi:hypothetical protein